MKTVFLEVTLHVALKAGATIGDVIQEATILALTENRKVFCTFNDSNYIINPGKLLNNIHTNPKAYE
jgi:hypothetical protein